MLRQLVGSSVGGFIIVICVFTTGPANQPPHAPQGLGLCLRRAAKQWVGLGLFRSLVLCRQVPQFTVRPACSRGMHDAMHRTTNVHDASYLAWSGSSMV